MWNRLNNGPPLLEDSHILIPGTCGWPLIWQKITLKIWLRILRDGEIILDCPAGPKYNQCPYKRQAVGDWTMEEKAVIWPQAVRSCLKLEEPQKEFSSRASRVAVAVLTPWVLLSNTDFRVLAPKLWENKFLLSHQICANFLEQPQKKTTNAMEISDMNEGKNTLRNSSEKYKKWREKQETRSQIWKTELTAHIQNIGVGDYWEQWPGIRYIAELMRECVWMWRAVTPFWTHLGGKDPPLGIP